MYLDWPFSEKESLLALTCPNCSNQRIFEAYREREALRWRCGCCGASNILHLAKVLVPAVWLSGSKNPFACHLIDCHPLAGRHLMAKFQ